MSYYTGRGDYYSGKGDPGLLSTIGGAISKVGSILPGPLGAAASVVGGILGGGSSTSTRRTTPTIAVPRTTTLTVPKISTPAPVPVPGVTGTLQRLVPGGASGYTCPGGSGACGSGFHLDKTTGTRCVRNRKLNPANPAALRRAARRTDAFIGLARKALKNSNYKVVSKSYKQNWRKPLKR